MKAAIDAGKIGRPVLGVFQMFSWRDPSYYASDPWRGRWDAEGGGVLVNQSPHQLDLLRWFLGDIEEVSGTWANLNHPEVEVDDTAVATLRFKNGGLGSIVTSLSQKPGLYTKVHVHGSNGASVGVETDRGATFIAGVSSIAEPPLNDLWTIPGEEDLLPTFQAEDRARFAAIDATAHYHALQIRDFLRACLEGRPPARDRRGWPGGRRPLHRHLSIAPRRKADPLPAPGRGRRRAALISFTASAGGRRRRRPSRGWSRLPPRSGRRSGSGASRPAPSPGGLAR